MADPEKSKTPTFMARVVLLAGELFKVSLVTYLALYLIEQLREGFVTYFFSMNVLSYVTIALGTFTFLFAGKPEYAPQISQSSSMSKVLFVAIAIISAVVVYFIVKPVGLLAYIVAPLAGIIIFLLVLSINSEKNDYIH